MELKLLELKQYISRLNLGSRICTRLFLAGIVLKLLISYAFTSDYTIQFFVPFVEYFVNSNFSNPYQEFSTKTIEIFPYPALMLYILTIPQLILGLEGQGIAFSSLILKIPLLIADISIFFILKSLLNHKHILKLILIYWFSPVLTYISYIHGQLDIIPIALIFVSLYFLFKNSLNISSVFLAFSIATKTVIFAVIPILIIFLLSQKLKPFAIIKFLIITIFTFLLINILFIDDSSFIDAVFKNQQQTQLLLSSLQFGSLSLYLLPIAYFAILSKGFSMKTLNKDSFLMFLGFSLGVLLVFTTPSQGWYFWLLPFLMYFFVKASSGFFLLASLQAAYFIFFIFQGSNDFLVLQGNLYALFPPSFQSNILIFFGVEEALVHNLSYTFLQSLLILNCYLIYNRGINRYSHYKITSVPFLMGIGGNSGSGKTTLANALVKIFNSHKSIHLQGDDLHKWERGNQKWLDHTHLDPRANRLHHEIKVLKNLMNGEAIYRSKYNHNTGKFDKPLSVRAKNLIFYEGLHPFFLERQRRLFDLKVFLNPSIQLNLDWKISRDIEGRGKSKNDVIKQIELRAKDSESYIQSQLKFADIIIVPTMTNVNGVDDISYKLVTSNSFFLDDIFIRFKEEPGIKILHDFTNESSQSISIEGTIESDKLQLISEELIEGIKELGISNPSWPSNSFGVIIFIIVYLIFAEAEHERN
ncbi:hypothetical protein N9A24_02635 [Gammaproteobacteria bacterium]|nr:hypothetical protein [Gammaproteobacteria bacterium]